MKSANALKAALAALALGLPGLALAQTVPNSEMIASARHSCEQGDFGSFFDLFVRTPEIRNPFLASEIEMRVLEQPDRVIRSVDGRHYSGEGHQAFFKIAGVDWYWADASSVSDDQFTWLKLDWSELPDGTYRVDYVKAEYDGQSEGDSLGNVVRAIGAPGAYVFERKDGCWQLTQDLRSQPPVKAHTPLGALLAVFASQGEDDGYDRLSGVEWTGYTDVRDGAASNYVRKGKLLLAGFGTVRLPRGMGADAATVVGNEGDARVTLAGFTVGGVYRVSVQKFYPSTDYEAILQRQLGARDKLTLVAYRCRRGLPNGDTSNEGFDEFYRIDLADGEAPLFVRASRDEAGSKYSPGYTFFDFSREEPVEMIEIMQCRRAG